MTCSPSLCFHQGPGAWRDSQPGRSGLMPSGPGLHVGPEGLAAGPLPRLFSLPHPASHDPVSLSATAGPRSRETHSLRWAQRAEGHRPVPGEGDPYLQQVA